MKFLKPQRGVIEPAQREALGMFNNTKRASLTPIFPLIFPSERKKNNHFYHALAGLGSWYYCIFPWLRHGLVLSRPVGAKKINGYDII